MLEHERNRIEDCGCRYDAPTGVNTHWCDKHDTDGKKKRLRKFAQACRKNAGLPEHEEVDA
ncbi:MAG: hypothetical protein C4586_08740 [Anaerolineaceae bacterium]|nr:MAG: hypothetical protein C4586_08740 [Anaerolineaceae bacterium]